jgi:hypothetical protein
MCFSLIEPKSEGCVLKSGFLGKHSFLAVTFTIKSLYISECRDFLTHELIADGLRNL